MCGLRERGLNQKKTKTKHPKELKHFQLRTVRPEQDPRGAEQRSEIRDATWTASWQKKRFYTPQLPPFWPLLVLQTECAWRETRRASMPKRIHTCGSHHLGDSIPFCCKAPWEKQKHKNKTETWHQLWGLMPRRGASGPRTASDGVIFIHVKSPSRSHKHARELLELKLIPQHTHTHTREDRDEL